MVIMAQMSTNESSGSLTTIVHSQTKCLLLVNYRGEYICFATSGQDLRDKGLVGSVYIPVTCQMFIYRNGEVEFGSLGPVNTNPIGPVAPEKAPIKAHLKGTFFGAQGERFGASK